MWTKVFSFHLPLGCMVINIVMIEQFWLSQFWQLIPIEFVEIEIFVCYLIEDGSINTIDVATKFGPLIRCYLGRFFYSLIIDPKHPLVIKINLNYSWKIGRLSKNI